VQREARQRFAISEVAADCHELMIPKHIMRPPVVHANKQLNLRCSMQTYHAPICHIGLRSSFRSL